jgi:hypothetical protein
MDDDVCAHILSPRSQRSKQNSKNTDHYHSLPTLIEVKQTKHQPLPQYGHHHASGQRVKLPLYISPKYHLLANAGGDRNSNPNQDFKRALWQLAIDRLRTARPQQLPKKGGPPKRAEEMV